MKQTIWISYVGERTNGYVGVSVKYVSKGLHVQHVQHVQHFQHVQSKNKASLVCSVFADLADWKDSFSLLAFVCVRVCVCVCVRAWLLYTLTSQWVLHMAFAC